MSDDYAEWSADQLRSEAASLGADVRSARSRQDLIALLDRQQHLVLTLREPVLESILAWANTPVPTASPGQGLADRKDALARAVVSLKTMRFDGLDLEQLQSLAVLRGIPLKGNEPEPVLLDFLYEREGLLDKLNRKRRGFLGKLAEKVLGVAPPSTPSTSSTSSTPPPLRREVEEQGLVAGIRQQIRREADAYISEKLDEIEARIDRKLDEIDSRLADWRDKEIANRIRIIKITLWATLVISLLSLLYIYLKGFLT
jgi:hypothetical protein